MNGIWQVMNEANYDLEPHMARHSLQLREGPRGPLPDIPTLRMGAVGAVPGSLGVIVGGWFSENFYVLGGFEDANSIPADPFAGFDTFFNDNEYFKHIEVGWTTAKDRAYVDNLHLTVWHADAREAAGVGEGLG